MSDLVGQRLTEAEAVIERGLATFVEVGAALMRIRDERLYRVEYGTFEDYCRERWGMSRQRAHQMIEAAEITEAVSTMVDVPVTSERQARELTGLDPETAAEVMETAAETGKVTAASIRDARAQVTGVAKITTTTRTTEATKVERDVDLDTGEILDSATIAGRAAADRAPLPRIPRSDAEWERERIGKQNGWIARALKHLDGMQDPDVRARLVREWDPTNCDDNPSTVDPALIADIADGLRAFAKELKGRHVRVI